MTKGKYILIAVVIAVLAGGAFALTQKKDKEPAANTATTQNTGAEPDAAESNTSSEQSAAATITYTDDGFSPSKITVKTGTTVTIKNESSHGLQFDSDPHPAHTGNEELNVNNVPTGGSETFTVKRTGTFGYHNHLNPSDTGTIVVE